jgi:DNA adenine methylase
MKPFLKWVGGKTQILPTIIKYLPAGDTHGTYYEPFLGGGSVLLGFLETRKPTCRVVANDLNQTLIETWQAVQSDPDGLYERVKELVDAHGASDDKKEFYYSVRTAFNLDRTPERFIYLNKMCFRGLWREGPNGFNVPYGNYKKPEVLNLEHIQIISKLVQNVQFVHGSYESALPGITSHDFVYMDPPYAGTFTAYNRHKWDDQMFFDFVKGLPCEYAMSNSDADIVTHNFTIAEVVQVRRAITSTDPSKKANEVIIVSGRSHTRYSSTT